MPQRLLHNNKIRPLRRSMMDSTQVHCGRHNKCFANVRFKTFLFPDFLIREGIQVQVQKVIQGLEDADDSQATSSTHCKLEPVLEINPKEEILTAEEHDLATGGAPKERPYACEECGKSFLLKHHLTTHARVHTGERPHVCVHCGKSFAHKHCLNTHLLLHSTDRPYQCSECKKSFTLKHHLLTHSRVHRYVLPSTLNATTEKLTRLI